VVRATGLHGFAGGLGFWIAFRMLLGVGESIYFPASVKIVSVLFAPADRGLPAGLFNAGAAGGLVIGAPLTALLIARFGWRGIFLLVGLAALLWLVPWLGVFPFRFPSAYARASETTAAPSPHRRRLVSCDRNLTGICLGFFCWDYYQYLPLTWLLDYLITVLHFRLFAAGIYTAMPLFIFMVGQPLGGWISDCFIRYGRNETAARKILLTIAFSCGVLLIPATIVRSATAALWLIFGAGFVGFAGGNVYVFAQSCAPENEVGIWTGFMNFAGNVGGILASLTTGFLIARTGSYSPGFAIGPVLIVAGILSYWLIVGDLTAPLARCANSWLESAANWGEIRLARERGLVG
jgi:MFS family permease